MLICYRLAAAVLLHQLQQGNPAVIHQAATDCSEDIKTTKDMPLCLTATTIEPSTSAGGLLHCTYGMCTDDCDAQSNELTTTETNRCLWTTSLSRCI